MSEPIRIKGIEDLREGDVLVQRKRKYQFLVHGDGDGGPYTEWSGDAESWQGIRNTHLVSLLKGKRSRITRNGVPMELEE